MEQLSVFQYTDFQEYLRAWFEQAKQAKRGITLQSVSAKLGLKSRSHLHRILHDHKPALGEALLAKLCELLALRPREQEYLIALVDFNRADTLTQKNDAYRRMHALLALRDPSPLKPDRFAYFSDWVLPTLREVAVFPKLKGNHAAIAKCFDPALSEEQVAHGLETLQQLGFLRVDSKGRYTQVDPVVDTGDDLTSLAVYNFQLETLDLARIALDKLDPENREIGTVTFSIPSKAFPAVREVMRKARDEVVRVILEQGQDCDQVFQWNTQCFPLTRKL
jgi:uncharacterized protein (TIGR02147 family)